MRFPFLVIPFLDLNRRMFDLELRVQDLVKLRQYSLPVYFTAIGLQDDVGA